MIYIYEKKLYYLSFLKILCILLSVFSVLLSSYLKPTHFFLEPFLFNSNNPIFEKDFEKKKKENQFYPGYINTTVNDTISRHYGYITKEGKWVVMPIFYGAGYNWELFEKTSIGYLYPIKMSDKWGFLNSDLEWVIKPIYDYVEEFGSDLTLVRRDDQFFYVNTEGQEIIQLPKNMEATSFSNGLALTGVRPFDSIFVINELGDTVFEMHGLQTIAFPGSLVREIFYTEGLMPVLENGKWGYTDSKGNWMIPAKYDEVKIFSEGLAAVKMNNLWGFINHSGKWVVRPQYENVKSYSEGLSGVMLQNKWGFIDKNGEIRIPCQFEHLHQFVPLGEGSEDFAYVFKEGLSGVYDSESKQWGYIDTDGKWVIAPKYYKTHMFINGVALTEDNYSKEYIQKNGDSIKSFP